MNFQHFKAGLQAMSTKELMLYGSNSLLVLAIVMMAGKMASDHERIVLTPPNLNEKVVVEWHNASSAYFQGFGFYLTSLIGSLNPRNREFVFAALESVMDASAWSRMRDQLNIVVNDDKFKNGDAVTWFDGKETRWDPSIKRLYVSGYFITHYPGHQAGKSSNPVTYQFDLSMERGVPRVTAFNSYPDLEPHDAAWHARQNPQSVQEGARS